MGQYREPDWYDETKWMKTVKYQPPWPKMHWWVRRYATMLKFVPKDTSAILDLGCGNGIFSAFLHHTDYAGEYLGIDFSEGSITQAIIGNQHVGNSQAQFITGDILNAWNIVADRGYKPDLVICAETLEHLNEGVDKQLIEDIPTGMTALITVPRFDAPGHVRWFLDWEEVEAAYAKYFEDVKHTLIKAQWRYWKRWCHLFTGVKK